jgi:diaminohydroxyphosphoribosylaminopyrimidine deaminase/5-amino-6-(5-phosphoribosylamino)uracil reductase
MDEVVPGQKITDDQAMALAIAWSQKGLGWVSPNPPVGCVILDKNGLLLSAGFHEKFGGPHAEINALRGLSNEQLKDARVFVTLEPCAHFGKTPPCAETLAKLPLHEVVFGLLDPNPLVRGAGAQIIQSAGIKVTHNQKNETALERSCEHFLKNMRANTPFVSLKIATSLDGKIALSTGQSQWITGSESREQTHILRAIHDAILVGVGTYIQDNPSLDIRHPLFPQRRNKVVVVDPRGRGTEHIQKSKLFASRQPGDISWVVHENTSILNLQQLGIDVIKLPHIANGTSLDLKLLGVELWKRNIASLLVEGGAQTISSFINQGAADRLFLFIAPLIIGDSSGLSWSRGINMITELKQSVPLSPFEMSTHGKDLLLTCRFL